MQWVKMASSTWAGQESMEELDIDLSIDIDKVKNISFDSNKYLKDSPPLTDREFKEMMLCSNDVIIHKNDIDQLLKESSFLYCFYVYFKNNKNILKNVLTL